MTPGPKLPGVSGRVLLGHTDWNDPSTFKNRENPINGRIPHHTFSNAIRLQYLLCFRILITVPKILGVSIGSGVRQTSLRLSASCSFTVLDQFSEPGC